MPGTGLSLEERIDRINTINPPNIYILNRAAPDMFRVVMAIIKDTDPVDINAGKAFYQHCLLTNRRMYTAIRPWITLSKLGLERLQTYQDKMEKRKNSK